MWLYIIIALIVGLIIGIAATSWNTANKLKEHEQINQEIKEENKKAQEKLNTLNKDIAIAESDLDNTKQQNEYLNEVLSNLTEQINKSQKEADDAVETYYNTALQAAQQNIQADIENLEKEYAKAEEEYKEEYLITLQENTTAYSQQIEGQKQLIFSLDKRIDELKQKVTAAVAANIREAEKEQKKDFYRLILSDIDIAEIKKLRSIIPYLRNSEPLNKVIWKVYYENPYTDLIGRVLGSGIHTGIYKITNIENGMCYVGQAVDIANRWKQHIKRGIGAETPTRNKLYPAMLASGVENFTFEVVEECTADKLNDREDFWQDYFRAKEFGYSIK